MTHSPSTDLASRVASGFQKIALVLRHEAWLAAGARGITPTQAQIMEAVHASRTTIGVGQLAEQLALTKATVSAAVTTLESKGLLQKKPSPSDGRALCLELTKEGKREMGESSSSLDTILKAVKGMSSTQQGGLMEGLIATIHSLETQGHIPTAHMCVSCTHFRPNQHKGKPKPHHCALLRKAIGQHELRIECAEHQEMPKQAAQDLWSAFSKGLPLKP